MVALLALLPLTVILAVKAASLGSQVLVNVYGIGVLSGTIVLMYISFGNYRDPSLDANELREKPLVTCLLAVKDDIDVIEQTVRSLLAQTYGNCEVIVADDMSTDGTRELLGKLSLTLPFRFIALDKNVGKKRALVAAAAEARGSYFVFTDSDCILESDAVERCMLAFQAHPGIGAISGHARALNRDKNLLTKVQDVWYDGQFNVSKAAESVLRSVTCVSGPLAAFRREAIYNYLPAWAGDSFLGREFRFATDRQLTGYVLGQYWIGRKLKRQYARSPFVVDVDYPERKWGVAYVRSAKAWTNVPETFRSVIKQQVRWKKSFFRNLFFTGSFYWRRGIVAAALFYSHALWVLVAPVLAFRHLLWLPLHGQVLLTGLYLGGVLLKGSIWGLAYRAQNKGDGRWVYRPLMSAFSAVILSWLLVYSLLTLRKSVWARG
ncbi:glycosyltransferase [Couchioplanes caeruleus]|uniref:glycosyltransferase family 2 protein n=1 Tax=Couchioplanes caeruleus TaxID=56438 RepID=UPI0020BF5C2C|nr:glycosyltransferase [Couchioplanes caeruleus]UQU68395.1 glycosyltransferase [Couchioplanes caeruleus]